ncbi:hypothetical protein [Schlesneria paludicola]|uniref:hypothetical protein n=1 Tax=Schlesneria paludicola TaxID=360056 RepID=UPI00029A7E7D|nr:hypothetical protein [Schlesneria paludicola]
MKVALRPYLAIGALTVSLAIGCGTGKDDVTQERLKSMAGGTLKATVPVSGTVSIDGTPQAGVNLFLHTDKGGPPIATCRSGENGTYCWSTNLSCDGVEAGSYLVGFEYIPKQKKNDSGVDLFKGKYKNPMKGDFKLTVEKDKPQKDVNYELSLKK